MLHMAVSRQSLQVFCIALFLFSSACGASSQDVSSHAELTNNQVIKVFIGTAKAHFPAEGGPSAASIYDRTMAGFELGPQRLVLNSGIAIYWGEKYQEGNLQSVMIVDTRGRVRLVAVVDNIVRIARAGEPLFSSMGQYRREVKRREDYGSSNSQFVSVFVRNAQDLGFYLPYLMRWVQADLLGFNVQCDESQKMTHVCAMAGHITVPVQAYVINARGSDVRSLPVAKVASASVPLESFKW
jgi:hypothetical protein